MTKYVTYLRYEKDGQIKEKIKENKTLKKAYHEIEKLDNVKFYKIYDIRQIYVNYMPKVFKRTFAPKLRIDKKYSIEEVHALFDKWEKLGSMAVRKRKRLIDNFDGYPVKTWSQRYELFKQNIKCVSCGLEANCYRLEKDEFAKLWHFNLYYADDEKEILFTKDHIKPRSLKGKNEMSNYQTMCYLCNQEKADTYEED